MELGRLPWHSEVPFTASFTNACDEPVTILALKPACGCTVLDVGAHVGKTVAPGETLDIRGRLEVGVALGQRVRDIDLMLETGAVHRFSLKYAAFSTYVILPEQLNLGRIDPDDEEDVVATAVFSSKLARVVEPPVPDSPWPEGGVHERGNGETEIAVHLIKRNLPDGKNFGRLLVNTDDPYQPSFSLHVAVEAAGRLRAIPSHVFLRAGEERRVSIVDTTTGFPVPIAELVVDSTQLDAQLNESRTSILVRCAGQPPANSVVVYVYDNEHRRTKFLVSGMR